MKRFQKNTTRGFTLIELMVSLSIFAITIMISVGTLLIMIDSNAKAQALYSATTNLSYVLDSMTREMRMGYNYYCADGGKKDDLFPTGGDKFAECAEVDGEAIGDFIAFTREVDGARVGYALDADGKIYQKIDPDFDSWEAITSSDLFVESFEVEVKGAEPYIPDENDEDQPTVRLRIRGYVNNGLDEDTTFDIQTRISQRRLDI